MQSVELRKPEAPPIGKLEEQFQVRVVFKVFFGVHGNMATVLAVLEHALCIVCVLELQRSPQLQAGNSGQAMQSVQLRKPEAPPIGKLEEQVPGECGGRGAGCV